MFKAAISVNDNAERGLDKDLPTFYHEQLKESQRKVTTIILVMGYILIAYRVMLNCINFVRKSSHYVLCHV